MKLLVVDDHPAMRIGVTALLTQAGGVTEVLEAGSGPEGLALAQRHADLDAAFVDGIMPGMDSMAMVQELLRCRPELPVIMFCCSEDPAAAQRSLTQGAMGYIPKSASPQTILSAFRLVMSGNVYVPPLLLKLPSALHKGADSKTENHSNHPLTARQLTVLKFLCDGLSNKEISRHLGLSDKTVKAHISGIFKALRVANRTQAMRAAQAVGMYDPDISR